MIRALFGSLAPVDITVLSSDESQGTVSGGGTYYPGDTARLVASPAAGYRFAGWSNGVNDNPYLYPVTTATILVGSFIPDVGIGEIDNSELKIEISGLTVTVDNPTGDPVTLFDIQGRHLATSNLPFFNFHFSNPGVYLLRCGATVRKIVAL